MPIVEIQLIVTVEVARIKQMSNMTIVTICLACGITSIAILIIEYHVIAIKSYLKDIKELLEQIKK